MKCTSCGSVLADDASTCQACGTPVGAPVPSSDEAPPRPSGPSTQVSVRTDGAPRPSAPPRPSGPQRPAPRPMSNREEKGVVPVRVGDVLSGRYRLEQKVGEGGMGTVYVAHDQDLDRQVAVKLLAANLVTDDEVLERFEREAQLNAKLDHPNIAPVYDVGRHEGRPFIVMKLLEGDTLAAVLRSKGGFSSDETLRLMRQLAAGLDYIHGRGFIHRDIKAGNIFLSPTGHATILDFGILRPKSSGVPGLTRTGMVMGTPHYMAPEQALGLRDVDHKVDIYALAVVLFECLTGTLPFEADSELRLIQMQAHSPPPDILQRAPWIARPVAEVMKKALAKKPGERFDSGAELVRALEAAYRDSGGHSAAPPQGLADGTAPGWRMKAGLLSSLREKAGEPPSATHSPAPTTRPEPQAPSNERKAESSRSPSVPAAAEPRRSRLVPVFSVLGVLALLSLGAWKLMPPAALVNAGVDAGLLSRDAGQATLAVALDASVEEELDAGEALAVATPDAGAAREVDAGVRVAVIPGRKNGRINVITTHAGEPWWAQVTIDGVPRGRTPILLDLPVGKYQLRVERAGFRTERREIKVASGKSTVLRIDLIP